MIRAAFFDVDGTLLSHKTKQVRASTRRALDKLKAAGIRCVVATGRHIIEMDKLPVRDLEFDGYITLNGQLVLDSNREMLLGVPITGEARDFLVRMFAEKKIPALLMEKDRVYLNYVNPTVLAVQEAISSPVPPLGVYQGGEIYQVCPYFLGEEEALLAPITPHCVVTRWGFGGVDVIAKGGGKVNGIRRYLEENGIRADEIIAFGDGENDMEMLRFAGIGVAMGNAGEEVKAVADYVTSDVDEDGIANALAHFNLI